METRNENKIFWPAMAAISFAIIIRSFARGDRAKWSPHIVCLLLYLAFAGMSVLWAFSPELSFVRFAQQVMIVSSIVPFALFGLRTIDMLRGLFLCFGLACLLNVFFVAGGFQTIADNVSIGYSGYFMGKNYLGECAAIALLLSLNEIRFPGLRRTLGFTVAILAVLLIFFSNSKTALGLALLAPCLAGAMLALKKNARISPATFLFSVLICYFIFSGVTGFTINRVSYMLYGDSTFTGRQIIWDFAQNEIAHRPILGWGYQSYWLVGPTGPSIANAPGWVKSMPNAHNGYYDTLLEMGRFGLALLFFFILATLHAIGRMADRDRGRAWVALSVALFVIMYNGLESTWMRGFEFLWVVFLVLAVDIARYWQPIHRDDRSPHKPRLPTADHRTDGGHGIR
jgi:O-antigen ligase